MGKLRSWEWVDALRTITRELEDRVGTYEAADLARELGELTERIELVIWAKEAEERDAAALAGELDV